MMVVKFWDAKKRYRSSAVRWITGASGAPVFRLGLGVPMIVSVISAKSTYLGQPISLGSTAVEKIVILTDLASTSAADPTGSRGARFLRP